MAITRVSTRSASINSLAGLQASLARSAAISQQMSSGKRINKASDDPIGAAAAMRLTSDQAMTDQYSANVDAATGRLNLLDSSLSDITDVLTRVRTILVTANNAGVGDGSREALAAEISSATSQLTDSLNRNYLGRPIFGGTTTGTVAMNPAGVFVGDNLPVTTRIGNDTVMRVDVSGTDIGADTMAAMITRLASNVKNNMGTTDVDLTDIDAAIGKVTQASGDVGARANRVDAAKTALASQSLDYTAAISERMDIDLPATIIQMKSQELAYQAALASTARIMQVSLLDYLR